MSPESNVPQERAIVEVSSETQALVKEAMPNESEQIKNETMALIEAIKTKAQIEAQKAGEFTRDSYLDAVRSAREEIEKMNLFEPKRIEDSFKLMQKEVEKDWEALVKPMTDLGDRLSEAGKAAWEALTSPRSNNSDS
jgi:hypothetical protein